MKKTKRLWSWALASALAVSNLSVVVAPFSSIIAQAASDITKVEVANNGGTTVYAEDNDTIYRGVPASVKVTGKTVASGDTGTLSVTVEGEPIGVTVSGTATVAATKGPEENPFTITTTKNAPDTIKLNIEYDSSVNDTTNAISKNTVTLKVNNVSATVTKLDDVKLTYSEIGNETTKTLAPNIVLVPALDTIWAGSNISYAWAIEDSLSEYYTFSAPTAVTTTIASTSARKAKLQKELEKGDVTAKGTFKITVNSQTTIENTFNVIASKSKAAQETATISQTGGRDGLLTVGDTDVSLKVSTNNGSKYEWGLASDAKGTGFNASSESGKLTSGTPSTDNITATWKETASDVILASSATAAGDFGDKFIGCKITYDDGSINWAYTKIKVVAKATDVEVNGTKAAASGAGDSRANSGTPFANSLDTDGVRKITPSFVATAAASTNVINVGGTPTFELVDSADSKYVKIESKDGIATVTGVAPTLANKPVTAIMKWDQNGDGNIASNVPETTYFEFTVSADIGVNEASFNPEKLTLVIDPKKTVQDAETIEFSYGPETTTYTSDTIAWTWKDASTGTATGTLSTFGSQIRIGTTDFYITIAKDKKSASIVTKAQNATTVQKVTLVATIGSLSAECAIETADLAETASLTVDKTSVDLETGETATVKATALAEDKVTPATDEIIWESSDENVATVKDGVITAIGEGKATITVTSGEKTATVAVTVTKSEADKKAEAIAAAEAAADAAKAAPSDATIQAAKDAVAAAEKAGATTEDLKSANAKIAEAEAAKKAADEEAKKAEEEQKKQEEQKKAADGSAANTPAPVNTELKDAAGNVFKVTTATAGQAEVEFAGPADKNATKFTIPDTLKDASGNEYKVTSIAAGAFKDSKAKTVTIGKNIKSIDKNAFKDSKIKTVKVKGTKLTKKMAKAFNKLKKGAKIKVSGSNKKKNKKLLNALKNVKNGNIKVK